MKWTEIIVHHSGAKDLPAVDTQTYRHFHQRVRLWRDLGYHFVVELVGDEYEVLVGRMLNETGAHAPGHNSTAIGVCLAGDFTASPPPFAQLLVAARLVAGLRQAIPTVEEILLHRSVRATECPGKEFPAAAFVELVERELAP